MKELRGRTAVVTGAASGIGLGMATRFAEEGLNVVMSDIEQSRLEAAAQSVTAGINARPGQVVAVQADVSKPDSVGRLHHAAIDAFDKVHVVCANAGVVYHSSVWEGSLDDWNWVLGVNLWGVIHTLRAFIPGMLEHGEEGHIVITTSASGLTPWTSSAYTASKFAGLGIAEGLEIELANTPIGVTALNPGGVKTGIFDAERNRPAHLSERGALSERVKARNAQLTDPNRADQMSPAAMADQVVRAICARELYIMPGQESHRVVIRERLQRRLEALREKGI